MIPIQPIQLPFFGEVTQVKVYVPKFILGQNSATVCVDLMTNSGDLWKTIEQPLPENLFNQWGVDDSIVINWVLIQNNIVKL